MEDKKEIIKALLSFQESVPKLELNSEVKVTTKTGGKYTFKYADLPYIVDIIKPTLIKVGILVHYELNESKIILHLIHSSGQSLTSSLEMKLSNNPQENGSLITYYKRYLLTSALNLVTEEDDDGNASQGNKTEKVPQKPWLNPNTKDWENATSKLKSGKVELTKVLDSYRVSKPNQEILEELVLEATEQAFKNDKNKANGQK